MTVDALFETPYQLIDVLPEQVPADSPGQYFAVEKYVLETDRLALVKRKHANLLLKLNCYRSLSLGEDQPADPPPASLAEAVMTRRVCVLTDGAMIVSEPDDLALTVYNADGKLLALLRALAFSEGLFLREPGEKSGF